LSSVGSLIVDQMNQESPLIQTLQEENKSLRNLVMEAVAKLHQREHTPVLQASHPCNITGATHPISQTRGTCTSDTTKFPPATCKVLTISHADVAIFAVKDLTQALENKLPYGPFTALGDAQTLALQKLANIFNTTVQPQSTETYDKNKAHNKLQRRTGESDVMPIVIDKVLYELLLKDRDTDHIKIELEYRGLATDGRWRDQLLKRIKQQENNTNDFLSQCLNVVFSFVWEAYQVM
jgi:hypothetical protein